MKMTPILIIIVISLVLISHSIPGKEEERRGYNCHLVRLSEMKDLFRNYSLVHNIKFHSSVFKTNKKLIT